MDRLEEVKAVYNRAGAILLEGEYVNVNSIMKYQCCCGTIDSKMYKSFYYNPKCSSKDHDRLLQEKRESSKQKMILKILTVPEAQKSTTKKEDTQIPEALTTVNMMRDETNQSSIQFLATPQTSIEISPQHAATNHNNGESPISLDNLEPMNQTKKLILKISKPSIIPSVSLETNDVLASTVTISSKYKNRENWTYSKIIESLDTLFKNSISYIHMSPSVAYSCKTEFELECKICTFVWPSYMNVLLKLQGCPWCRNECLQLKKYTLRMIEFIAFKIYNGKYIYSMNNPEEIFTCKSLLKIRCKKENHKIFEEKLSDHLSRSIRKTKDAHKSKCPECAETEKTPRILWKHRLDLVISEGERIYGKGTYDYSKNKKEDILNANSELTIICKKLTIDGVCNIEFNRTIHKHINHCQGCASCATKPSHTLDLFKKKFVSIYGEKFIIDHLTEEDIRNAFSKPKLICSTKDCGFIVDSTTIAALFNPFQIRQCDRCENKERWTPERAKSICDEKAKEGIYDYSTTNFINITSANCVLNITCNPCKNKNYKAEFNLTLHQHINLGTGCARCGGKMQWNYARLMEEIPPLFKIYYDYSLVKPEMVTGNKSIIPVGCKECKNIFSREVGRHIWLAQGCSFCKKSNCSKLIFMFLKSNHILFEDEYPCVGINDYEYYYDYKVLYNNETYIIEYDGGQHFCIIPSWSDAEKHHQAQLRDIHKQYLALKNGWNIIRIDYSIRPYEIEGHLKLALSCNQKEYYSTPNIYDWLIEGVKNYSLQ